MEDWRKKYLKEAETVTSTIVTRDVPIPPLDSLPDDQPRADVFPAVALQELLDAPTFRLRADIVGQGYWTPWQFCRDVILTSLAAGLYGTGQASIEAAQATIEDTLSGPPPKVAGGFVGRWLLRHTLLKVAFSTSKQIVSFVYRLK